MMEMSKVSEEGQRLFVLPSPNDDDDQDEIDAQRFGQQVAQQSRIDRQRSESR